MTLRHSVYHLPAALVLTGGALLAACASAPPSTAPHTGAPVYGPLQVNLAQGADFYITQNGLQLLVYSGKSWSDGSSTLMDETSRAITPLAGYAHAWQIDELLFVNQPDKNLATFYGTLFGYIAVYHHHERGNGDIMPIQLVFPDR